MIGAYVERFEHPYLFSLLPITVLLFALAVVADQLGWDAVAGFLALYSVIAVFVWVLGYAAFYLLRYGNRALRWWRVSQGTR